VAKLFEPRAAPIEERIGALERIHSLGIKTFAFVGPLLPGNPEKLIKNLKLIFYSAKNNVQLKQGVITP